MLGLALMEWPDDALRRVLDAPVERWAPGVPGANMGCLYAHGCGRLRYDGWALFHNQTHASRWVLGYGDNPPRRFDFLCGRFGTPRVVRAIKIRALAILEARRATASIGHPEQRVRLTTKEASNGYG